MQIGSKSKINVILIYPMIKYKYINWITTAKILIETQTFLAVIIFIQAYTCLVNCAEIWPCVHDLLLFI